MVRRGPRIIAISDVGPREGGYQQRRRYAHSHTLEEMAIDGIPDSKIDMPETIRDYHQYRENITSTDGVILYKERIIVPPSFRGQVLSTLLAAHHGVSMMTARAESSVFWPGISSDISTTRKKPANTATGWHPHSLEHRPPHRSRWSTTSRQCSRTSSYTVAYTTS